MACTCAYSGPACQSFWNVDFVFSADVIAIENISAEHQRRVTFKVRNQYRGQLGEEVVVLTGMGGGDCGYVFQPGRSYLVWARLLKGELRTGICSRTAPLEEAQEDLAWLHDLPWSASGGTIFGTVRKLSLVVGYYDLPGIPQQTSVIPGQKQGQVPIYEKKEYAFATVPITITDSAGIVRSAVTDESGAFSVAVAPGDHTVTIMLPREKFVDVHFGGESRKVTVHDRGCAQVPFLMSPNGRIRGHVRDSAGRPVAKFPVALSDDPYWPASGANVSQETSTNPDGFYEFTGLLPGPYHVFINPYGPTKERPYPSIFYNITVRSNQKSRPKSL